MELPLKLTPEVEGAQLIRFSLYLELATGKRRKWRVLKSRSSNSVVVFVVVSCRRINESRAAEIAIDPLSPASARQTLHDELPKGLTRGARINRSTHSLTIGLNSLPPSS